MAPKIEASFTASGDVSDYDMLTRDNIQSVFANAAGVSADDIELTITSGSVVIEIVITVPTGDDASSIASSLATGIFTNETVLQNALAAGGVTGVTVEGIIKVPSVSDPPQQGLDATGIALISVFVPVGILLVIGLFFYFLRREQQHADSREENPAKVSTKHRMQYWGRAVVAHAAKKTVTRKPKDRGPGARDTDPTQNQPSSIRNSLGELSRPHQISFSMKPTARAEISTPDETDDETESEPVSTAADQV